MSQSTPIPAYVGVWRLVPELCLYQSGDPPTDGLYTIACEGDAVRISVEWTTQAGERRSLAFGGPVDGSLQETDIPGLTHTSFTHVDDTTLDSAAFNDGVRLAYARRRVSDDGQLLTTVQEAVGPKGVTRNFQVYRRT